MPLARTAFTLSINKFCYVTQLFSLKNEINCNTLKIGTNWMIRFWNNQLNFHELTFECEQFEPHVINAVAHSWFGWKRSKSNRSLRLLCNMRIWTHVKLYISIVKDLYRSNLCQGTKLYELRLRVTHACMRSENYSTPRRFWPAHVFNLDSRVFSLFFTISCMTRKKNHRIPRLDSL